MGVDMKVKAIYDSEIGNITRSEKNWKDVLKVAGQLYRYEFDNIVSDYALYDKQLWNDTG